MKTAIGGSEALHRLERSCREATTGADLLERLSDDMHAAIPHDGAIWFGADPATLLVTSPVRIEGMEDSACDPFWHHEFHVPDTASFVDLARSPEPASAMRLALDDRPKRSTRYRDLLAPAGYDDELRGVLRVGANTWGMVGLYRERGRPAFTSDDVALVGRASSIIGAALRDRVREQCDWLGTDVAPGLIIFDERSQIVSANGPALGWLRELVADEAVTFGGPDAAMSCSLDTLLADTPLGSDVLDPRRISPLWALLNRTRAVGLGIDDGPARLRLRDSRGRWLVLHGSCLSTHGVAGRCWVAIVIEPAKSSEIAPIIIEAYSLTRRERDVVAALARGDSTSEIASRLFLSPHTVRDHIKTVFEKVAVSSRAELVAKLFAEFYTVRAHADMVHD